MITIQLNGQPSELELPMTLDDAITLWRYQLNSIAVAINEVFIPKANYQTTIIDANDSIEIVTAMQGG